MTQSESPADLQTNADAWAQLSGDYERARGREDSLDRLVEWPAQRGLLGDVSGLSILDLGCGNGGKIAELVRDGADDSVGVDISGNFITAPPAGLQLLRADLSAPHAIPELTSRRFDRILFLQSFGYAADPVATLVSARELLTDDGFILLTRTQPIRYAVERMEPNSTSLGEEHFAGGTHSHVSGWNDGIALAKRTYTISDLLNVFAAAGLRVEAAAEPQLSEEDARSFPHKKAWMDKHLGILIFRLRPVAAAG